MNLILVEWQKLFKKKSTKVLLVIYAVSLMVMMFAYGYGEGALNLSILNSGQFTTTTLGLFMGFLLPFMTIYIASQNMIEAYDKQTIKNMYLMPIKKSNLFIAKIMGIQVFVGLLLVIQLVLTSLYGIIFDGLMTTTMIMTILIHYLGAFLILGLINIFSHVMSLVLKSTGIVLLVSYLTYMGAGILGFFVPRLKVILPGTMISNYAFLFTSVTLLLSVLAYYIILYIVGYQLFEKKEVMICQSE